MRGEARLRRPTAEEGPLDLDSRDLTIHSVIDTEGRRLPFVLWPPDPIVGTRLPYRFAGGRPRGHCGVRDLAGEVAWRVPSLAVPDVKRDQDLDEVARSPPRRCSCSWSVRGP